jgi:hypothetical protein
MLCSWCSTSKPAPDGRHRAQALSRFFARLHAAQPGRCVLNANSTKHRGIWSLSSWSGGAYGVGSAWTSPGARVCAAAIDGSLADALRDRPYYVADVCPASTTRRS